MTVSTLLDYCQDLKNVWSCFKLRAVLNGMKSHFMRLHAAQDVNHPFGQRVQAVYVPSH